MNAVTRLAAGPCGLMFHHFRDAKHVAGQGSITRGEFAAIVEEVRKDRDILTPGDWCLRALEGTLTARDVCLTFDDALRCQYDVALPVLEESGLKAFWFVPTAPLDGVVEKTELYRYFRSKAFDDVSGFYAAFHRAVQDSRFASAVEKGLTGFDPEKEFKAYSFYSKEDKEFRYVRDHILGKADFQEIMDGLVARSGMDLDGIIQTLWLDEGCVRDIHRRGHMIGLHSHTHPTNLEALTRKEQEVEYGTNHARLKGILKDEIVSMSHPCNSYNGDTLAILASLGVRVGFRDNATPGERSKLEFPRIDHAFLR